MKKVLLLVLFTISSVSSNSWGMTNGDNPSMITCIQNVNNQLMSPSTGNFYYEFSEKNTLLETQDVSYQNTTGIDMAFLNARMLICQFYRIGGSMDKISIKQIIPIYQPGQSQPIAFQSIYIGQDYSKSGYIIGNDLLWGATTFPNGYSRILPWFDIGALADNFGIRNGWKGSSDAYLASQKEPFKSAPMLQMYYYLGQPLLVARSSTGIVTDVFFQGRTIVNPMERAKKYLGKKWYSP